VLFTQILSVVLIEAMVRRLLRCTHLIFRTLAAKESQGLFEDP